MSRAYRDFLADIVAHARDAMAYVDISILYRTARDLLPPLLPPFQRALDDVTKDETGGAS